MKGSYGLIVAAVVGVLGAVLNWIYLENKTRDVETVTFLGLRDNVSVNPGEVFEESDFEPVPIPKRHAKNLHKHAHLYSELPTVVNESPTRSYEGGQLILREDLRTPPTEIAFTSPNQRLVTIEVDSRKFESSHYKPGDKIDFIIPKLDRPGGVGSGSTGQDDFETVGPFTIAHIGERLGSKGAALAGRARTGQESTIGIFATWEGDQLDAQTRKLLSLVDRVGGRGVRVMMHSRLKSAK